MTTRLRTLCLLLVAALALAACSGDDDTDTGSTEAGDGATTTVDADADADADADESAEPVAKPAVSITAVSFEAGTVTIRNDGDTDLSLDGMFMCNRPSYAGLPAETVAPGATYDVDVSAIEVGSSFGEFALYTSNDFGSAEAIVAYVQWGSAEQGRSSVAVEAGLISEGEFVDNGEADFTLE